jgi:hypothetical protein
MCTSESYSNKGLEEIREGKDARDKRSEWTNEKSLENS